MGSKCKIWHYLPVIFYVYIIESGDSCERFFFSLLKCSCTLRLSSASGKNLKTSGDLNSDPIDPTPRLHAWPWATAGCVQKLLTRLHARRFNDKRHKSGGIGNGENHHLTA